MGSARTQGCGEGSISVPVPISKNETKAETEGSAGFIHWSENGEAGTLFTNELFIPW